MAWLSRVLTTRQGIALGAFTLLGSSCSTPRMVVPFDLATAAVSYDVSLLDLAFVPGQVRFGPWASRRLSVSGITTSVEGPSVLNGGEGRAHSSQSLDSVLRGIVGG